MGKRFVILLFVLSIATPSYASTFDQRVSDHLTGGSTAVKSMSVWQLEKYKRTDLMRKSPMRWCPWEAYLVIDKYVTITESDNRYYFNIKTDLTYQLRDVAKANKRFAKAFKVKGTDRQKVKRIYKYCAKTKYICHVKSAQSVFQNRTGDCVAIASAFYILCQAKHIPVRFVIGWTSDSCHAWNMVKVNGKWYWVDATHELWLSRKQFAHRSIMEMW